MEEHKEMARMLNAAACLTKQTLKETTFNADILYGALYCTTKTILYVHLNDTQKAAVSKFFNAIPGLPPNAIERDTAKLQLEGATLVAGPKMLMLLKPSETTINSLASQMDPTHARRQQPCFTCHADAELVDDGGETRQCMYCTVQLCRACVRDLIDERAARFTGKDMVRGMTAEKLDDMFCPRCPNCNEQRLGDLYRVRARMLGIPCQ